MAHLMEFIFSVNYNVLLFCLVVFFNKNYLLYINCSIGLFCPAVRYMPLNSSYKLSTAFSVGIISVLFPPDRWVSTRHKLS